MPTNTIIPLICKPSEDFVVGLLAAWISKSVAVPLNPKSTESELQYFMQDTQAQYVYRDSSASGAEITKPEASGDALVIYTSGTTSRPKGVMHTFQSLEVQVRSLSDAWKWSQQDRILNVLPLYHVHGLVNVVLCSLFNGACLELMDGFDSDKFWSRIIDGQQLSLFMAVPAVYHRLITSYNMLPSDKQVLATEKLKRFRLFVSGSSSLPLTVLRDWERISSNKMLERYGMTEIGMALSQSYAGDRVPGSVGQTLPGVQVRLVDEQNHVVQDEGELQVKSHGMFRTYLNKPELYAKEFTPDGWFRTGDQAKLDQGSYQIVGRISTDIIKTKGYKVSALEIERVLLEMPEVQEACVIGVNNQRDGQQVKALVVSTLTPLQIQQHAAKHLSSYKVPSIIEIVKSIPKNSMGKVNKKQLV